MVAGCQGSGALAFAGQRPDTLILVTARREEQPPSAPLGEHQKRCLSLVLRQSYAGCATDATDACGLRWLPAGHTTSARNSW